MSAKKAQPGAARTQTYRAAYEQLSRIAAELEGGETDLDKVLPLLSEAQAAYEVCRERIEALRRALDLDAARAESDEAESGRQPDRQSGSQEDTEAGGEDADDDFF